MHLLYPCQYHITNALFICRVNKSGPDWQIVHELNGCGSDGSAIYSEGIANFYLDDLFKYESKLIAFNSSVSASLLELLKTAPSKMHGPKYNMLAYPFSTKYQNSNGYLIESIAVADAKSKNILLDNREAAQGYLEYSGFVPAVVEVGTFSRLGARMTRGNIAFDDQIFEQRMAGNIQTVTFDGIVDFLKKTISAIGVSIFNSPQIRLALSIAP